VHVCRELHPTFISTNRHPRAAPPVLVCGLTCEQRYLATKGSAPRLQSTSRSMCFALTSVQPPSGLPPLHPGCPPGMGMGPPAFWRGAGASCKRGFPPRRGAPPEPGGPNPRERSSYFIFRSRLIAKQGPLAIHRAMRSSYPLSFLLLPHRASRINSPL
jgi:hypothetical protein